MSWIAARQSRRAVVRNAPHYLNYSVGTSRSLSCSAVRFGAKDTVVLLDDVELAKTELNQLQSRADVRRSEAKDRQSFVKEMQDWKPKALYRHFGGARSVKVCFRKSYAFTLTWDFS